MVSDVWIRGVDAGVNISRMASKLANWSRKNFGNIAKKIRACQNHETELMEREPTSEVSNQMKSVGARMEELERKEEVY